MNKNFIFFSKRRGKRLWFFTKITIATFVIISCLIITDFLKAPARERFPANNVKPIIDEISTRKQETIDVNGHGAVLNVVENAGSHSLELQEVPSLKVVYLTFDDGPNAEFTPKILDILKKENVKATFFLMGENLLKNPDISKKILKDGHVLGLHTFTHTPEEKPLYGRDLQSNLEFEFTQKVLEAQTGMKSTLFRLPYWGGEDTVSLNSLVLMVNASQRGYQTLGSTVDSFDWEASNSNKIFENVVSQKNPSPVVLLHDGGGNRTLTVEALPKIINYYKILGYKFAGADKIYPNQKLIIPISAKEKIYAKATVGVFTTYKKLPKLTSEIFIIGLLAFGVHSVLISIFAFLHFVKTSKKKRVVPGFMPKVSVIVPAYNEERTISKTIDSLLAQTYKNFEVIIVNDGSTDKTRKKIAEFKNKKIKAFNKINEGKTAALNEGISRAKGEIIVTVDSDTQLLPGSIAHFVKHFKNKKIGAVAGNIKVGNRNNLLTLLQELDYLMALNLERRAYDFLESIFIVPGAAGAWRKQAIDKVGSFSYSTLTEDAELGMRLKKADYRIIYEPAAVAYTEAPENLRAFMRQRFRWTFGILQTLWLHRDIVFRKRYGIFGMVVMPYVVFVQIPTMALGPLVELAAFPLAIFVSYKMVALTLTGLLFGRFFLYLIAAKLGRERISPTMLACILPYRFIYQYLWYFVYDSAIFSALRGALISWKKLYHFGHVDVKKYSGLT